MPSTTPPASSTHDPARPALVAAVAVLVAIGVLLRLRHWWSARGLWADEVSIALNLLERSFLDLLEPLAFDQAAPVGWLWLERALLSLWPGQPELALRLPQFIFGNVGLVAVAAIGLAERRPWPALVPTAAVALFPAYVYYSAEVKQYMADFCAAALLLWIGLAALRSCTFGTRHLLAFALVGTAAVALSHASAFVIAGVGLALAGAQLRRGDGAGAVRVLALCALLAALYVMLHVLATRQVATRAAMRGYWRDFFAPLPWSSAKNAFWYYKAWVAPAHAAFT